MGKAQSQLLLWTPQTAGYCRRISSGGLTEARDNRFSLSYIPDVTGHHRRAENKVGAPRAKEKRGQGERGHWVVPTLVRVFGPIHD